MGRKIVLHLHTDVRDKKPSPIDIMDGELAINCAASGETLYIKNSEEAIAEFKDDKYYQKQLSELATKNELAQKQDIISDIDTIRNNAANYKGTVTGVKINGTTKNPSNGVVDLGTVITSHQDISGKQDKLVSGTNIKTINGESVLGGGDITISSGASSSAYPEVDHGTGDTTFTLTPNTFHVWDEVTSLTLNFGSGISGVANEYLFQFTSGPTATSLTLPDDIKWANDNVPTINRNMIYQVSVLRGLAGVLEFNNISLIFFYTNDSHYGPYQAEQGMTWEDWVNSKYNTNKATIRNNKIFIGSFVFIGVIPSDIIISDNTYTLQLD